MLLSTQTDVLAQKYGIQEAVRMLARAGFDAYDMSLFRMNRDPDYEFVQDSWRETAHALRKTADDAGIQCNQAHAPFPSSVGDPEKDEAIFQTIVQAMEIASILGAKIIVVHPKQHMQYAGHAHELKEMNIAFYKRLIPYCQKFGIKVATENMWQYAPGTKCIVDSTCASPEEFCAYVDEIGSPWITACLDVGHVVLVNRDLPGMIRALGHDRLQALHIHDNSLDGDHHTIPYSRSMDFPSMLQALAEIDYQGDFTFEADCFYKRMPAGLLQAGADFMCTTGRVMMQEIEKYRENV